MSYGSAILIWGFLWNNIVGSKLGCLLSFAVTNMGF